MPSPFLFSAPRDARNPVVERLEWLTDVQTSKGGKERRSQRRAFPRHTYTFDVFTPTPAAAACLAALRTQSDFLVPLWCHVFERPATSPDAGIEAVAPQVALLDHAGNAFQAAAPIGWSDTYDVAAPLARARFAADQRGISHATWQVSLASVSFRLIDFHEAVPAYSGPVSASRPALPLLDSLTEAGDSLAEQIDVNTDSADNGLIDLYEVRYVKRTYTLNVVLNTREKVLAFRSLLFTLRGRLNPVRWTAPGDAEEKTWRLASDAVELTYPCPGRASCTLSLTELDE